MRIWRASHKVGSAESKVDEVKKMLQSLNGVIFGWCSNCSKEHFIGNYTKAQVTEDVQAIAINANLEVQQTNMECKLSSLEDKFTQLMLVTQNELLRITKSHNLLSEKHEESMRKMEGQMPNLS